MNYLPDTLPGTWLSEPAVVSNFSKSVISRICIYAASHVHIVDSGMCRSFNTGNKRTMIFVIADRRKTLTDRIRTEIAR